MNAFVTSTPGVSKMKKTMSPDQLRQIISDAQAQLQESEKSRKVDLRNSILSLIEKEGFTMKDLFESRYTHPSNPKLFWNGRGPRPQWLRDLVEEAKTRKGKGFDEAGFISSLDENPSTRRYQNPDNHSQVWNGLGKVPKWVSARLKKGTSLEELAI